MLEQRTVTLLRLPNLENNRHDIYGAMYRMTLDKVYNHGFVISFDL